MEPTPKPNPLPKTNQEDVDLGQLFYKTGGAISSVLSGLNRLFARLSNAFLGLLFFLRRNFVWVLLGTLLGAGYGFYQLSTYGRRYTSDLTVKANFNSTRSLYGSIDYFNSLISNRRTDELSRVLKITPAEASSLIYMEANPLKSELITAQIYQDQFLKNQRGNRPRMDTFWIRTIDYKNFKTSLTKYDYPLHEITVTSTDVSIFPKIQQGIIDKISGNELLQQTKSASTANNKETVNLLSSSIKSLDTLRSTYNKRLSREPVTGDAKANSVLLMDGNMTPHFPELELYDKLLEMNDELKNAQSQSVLEDNIIQVYSPFPSMGQKEVFFKQSIVRNGLMGLFASLLILAGISLYKSLGKLEKERKAAPRQ